MTTIMNDTLKHKIDYKIDLDCSSNSISNMSNTTAEMNANMTTETNSHKIENKISNILIDKKGIKNTQYIVYKMDDLQVGNEITFTYTTKKNIQGGVSITIEKITPKYINNYKKEYITDLNKKIDLECDDDAVSTNGEDIENMNHQEQMNAHGYTKCQYCGQELPNGEIGQDENGDNICMLCNHAKVSDDEEEIVKCMRCMTDMEKKEYNSDGVGYTCDECLKQEDDEYSLILKQKEIENKLAELKHKKEAGQRREKVIEYLQKVEEERKVELTELINKKEQKLIQMKAELETLQKEKTDEELLGDMNFETIFETINKKKTKKTTKTDGKKTCVGKGDIRISSKVLNDGEIITMSGKWTELGTYKAIYDKSDDLFYELDQSGNRITTNNFENINKFGNHIYKNHQAEYENKKNMWAVMKLNRGGKWISMLDLPIIE